MGFNWHHCLVIEMMLLEFVAKVSSKFGMMANAVVQGTQMSMEEVGRDELAKTFLR